MQSAETSVRLYGLDDVELDGPGAADLLRAADVIFANTEDGLAVVYGAKCLYGDEAGSGAYRAVFVSMKDREHVRQVCSLLETIKGGHEYKGPMGWPENPDQK